VTALIELDRISRTFETPDARSRGRRGIARARIGEAMCLVGESGCGKTTDGPVLTGLIRPTSGRSSIEGKDVWKTKGADLAPIRRAVQLVHQTRRALNPTRTVYQTLRPALPAQKARSGRQALASVNELLKRVELTTGSRTS